MARLIRGFEGVLTPVNLLPNSDFSYGIFILMLREGFRYVASLIQSMNILALKLEKLDRIDLINAKLDKLSALLEKGEVKEVPEETKQEETTAE